MKKYLPSFLTFLTLLGIWEFIVQILNVRTFILPAPSLIGKTIYKTAPLLWKHSLHTVTEALIGFSLAIAAGILLAVLMGLIPFVKKFLYPLTVISQTVPIIAIAPLLIIWFGYGMLPKVIVVALVCFFPITVSLVEGLENTDNDMVKLLIAMGASTWQIFKKVKFPGAMPAFFSGLKISATYSVMGAVIGEWLGASKGLGIFMTRSMKSFLTEQVFASIIVITMLSLILFALIEVLGRILMPWYYQ